MSLDEIKDQIARENQYVSWSGTPKKEQYDFYDEVCKRYAIEVAKENLEEYKWRLKKEVLKYNFYKPPVTQCLNILTLIDSIDLKQKSSMTDQDKERIEKAFNEVRSYQSSIPLISKDYFNAGIEYEHNRLQPIIDTLKNAIIKGDNLYSNILFDEDEFTPYQKALREIETLKNGKIEGFNEGIDAARKILWDYRTQRYHSIAEIDDRIQKQLKKPI